MAIKKNSNTGDNKAKFEVTSLEVLRAKELKATGKVETNIAFDMAINGIKIYGCFYLEGEKDGKEWSMVRLPQTKGSDGNYYDIVWFPITKELTKKIADEIETKL